MVSKMYEKVLGLRISKSQKEKLDAIAQLAGEKSSRLLRDCIDCLIKQDQCLVRQKYAKLSENK